MRAGTWAQERPEGVEMRVFIQPRASKTEIVGLLGEALKIRIAAPPVDGQANAVLIRFLAHYLRIPQTHVQVIKGMNAKQKRIFIRGASLKHIQALLRSNSA